MCTLTYVPISNSEFLVTHNRDENPLRKTIEPKKGYYGVTEVEYPTDIEAGGTWIYKTDSRIACILNGGFVRHKRMPSYRKSRGLVIKESTLSYDSLVFISESDFSRVEPFTLVFFEPKKKIIRQLVWDGERKHISDRLFKQAHIWSSATLYDSKTQEKRKRYFRHWLKNNSPFDIYTFHKNEINDEIKTSIILNTPTCKTVSITQIHYKNGDSTMSYFPLTNEPI